MKESDIKQAAQLIAARDRLKEMRNTPIGTELLISKGNIAVLLPLSFAPAIIDRAEAAVRAEIAKLKVESS